MSYCTIKDTSPVEKERCFYPPCQKRQGHRNWPFHWQSLAVAVVRPHMPQLRIRYRIQAFCGYEAEEGVAKGVATKSENANVVIADAESENVAIVQKGSENVAIVGTENVAIEKGNVAIVETENVAIEKGNVAIVETENVAIKKGNVAIERESIETKENALKKNVSAVKCPEQTLYILQDQNLQYRLRHSFWL